MQLTRVGVLVVVAVLAVGATNGAAQLVRGTITDQASGDPVDRASVALLSAGGKRVAVTSSDREGNWALRAPSTSGVGYTIRVEKIGYATINTARFLPSSNPTVMNLQTRSQVTQLDEVSVAAVNYSGFQTRSQRGLHTLSSAEVYHRVQQVQPETTTRFLLGLLPTLTVGHRNGVLIEGCRATILLDGRRHDAPVDPSPPILIDELVKPWEIRGVELYDDPNGLPTALHLDALPRCGGHPLARPTPVIVIWTYRGFGRWAPDG